MTDVVAIAAAAMEIDRSVPGHVHCDRDGPTGQLANALTFFSTRSRNATRLVSLHRSTL